MPEQPYFYYYLTPNRVPRYLGKLLYMPDSEIETRISHLLILDEPSTGLDPLGKIEVRKILQETSEQGTTILLSSHQLSEVEEICDHLCIIDRGREVAQGSIPELLGEEESYQVTLDREEEIEQGKVKVLSVERSAGGTVFTIPRSNLDLFLRELSTRPARILEVKPLRVTLEEYFLTHVESRREQE